MSNLNIGIEIRDFDLERMGFSLSVLDDTLTRQSSEGYLRMSLAELGVFLDALKAAKGEIFTTEVRMEREGTPTAFLDVSVQPVKDGDGKIIYLLFEARDITDEDDLVGRGRRGVLDRAADDLAGGVVATHRVDRDAHRSASAGLRLGRPARSRRPHDRCTSRRSGTRGARDEARDSARTRRAAAR